MQDWHQKLHNNTTPDDVAICEAYIAFLENNGDNGIYWKILSDAGGVCGLLPFHVPCETLHDEKTCRGRSHKVVSLKFTKLWCQRF